MRSYLILTGEPLFSRRMNVCVCFEGATVFHIENFYGSDGRQTRSEAIQYGKDFVSGYTPEFMSRSTELTARSNTHENKMKIAGRKLLTA